MGRALAERLGYRPADLDRIPVEAIDSFEDGSFDVVISNGVINLAVDKPQVFREIARLLRGRPRLAKVSLGLRALPRATTPQPAGEQLRPGQGCFQARR